MAGKSKVGRWVRWTSQAGGYSTTKVGRVVAVVGARQNPPSVALLEMEGALPRDCRPLYNRGEGQRAHDSYIVAVKPTRRSKVRVYHPQVGPLCWLQAKPADAVDPCEGLEPADGE